MGEGTIIGGGRGLRYRIARRLVRRAIPPWDGELAIHGLREAVEVLRDAHGVPTILAASEDDLFFAQGWMHASDRLFHMELVRRVADGRLSELVGREGVRIDQLMRVLGFGRVVDRELELLDAGERRVLDRYAAGVNAFLAATPRRRLPLEHRLLRIRPEPWQPRHSLMFGKLVSFGLSGNWEAELVRAELLELCGADVLAALDGQLAPSAASSHLAHAIEVPTVAGLRASFGEARSHLLGSGIGSNAWAIAPERTATGGAILANDPHLDLGLPTLWYECVLRAPTFEVRGFSVPGTPGVVIGHNARIAWGITNSCADVQDLYVEHPGTRPDTYLDVGGVEREFDVRTEHIRVRLGRDETLRVRSTRRGPVLTDAIDTTLAHPLSIRWDSALQPGRSFSAVLGMNRARSWDEFRAAIPDFATPSVNLAYADADGNIGYQLTGHIPVRARSDGSVPLRGDDPAGEWTGIVPFEEMPASRNPEQGYVVTANNRVVVDEYPRFISREWMNGYRAARITERISAPDTQTVAMQAELQVDVHATGADDLLDAIASLDPEPATDAGRRAWQVLVAWDRELDAAGAGSRCYRTLVPVLQEQVFGFLGPKLLHFLGHSRCQFVDAYWSMWERTTPRIADAMRTGDTELLDCGARHAGERDAGAWTRATDWRELANRTLDAVGSLLEDPETTRAHASPARRDRRHTSFRQWLHRRGGHRIRFAHPLGALPLLGAIFDRGPFPIGGDPDTVWQASCLRNDANDAAMAGPTLRYVCDLSAPDTAVAVIAGGQSGHPTSPHYDDQLAHWLAGTTRPAPWTTDALRELAVASQRLVPAGA